MNGMGMRINTDSLGMRLNMNGMGMWLNKNGLFPISFPRTGVRLLHLHVSFLPCPSAPSHFHSPFSLFPFSLLPPPPSFPFPLLSPPFSLPSPFSFLFPSPLPPFSPSSSFTDTYILFSSMACSLLKLCRTLLKGGGLAAVTNLQL